MLVACLSVRAVGGGFWSSASRVVSSLGSQTSVYPHTVISPSAPSNEHHCSFCLSLYLASLLPSIACSWAPCLDGSWLFYSSGCGVLPSVSTVFSVYFLITLYFHFLHLLWFHFPVLCSFSTTRAHLFLSSWEARFSGCFIILENSVAVFFDQDKWGSFSSMQTFVPRLCVWGLCSGFMWGVADMPEVWTEDVCVSGSLIAPGSRKLTTGEVSVHLLVMNSDLQSWGTGGRLRECQRQRWDKYDFITLLEEQGICLGVLYYLKYSTLYTFSLHNICSYFISTSRSRY